MTYEYLQFSVRNHVAFLTLDRPKSLNAMNTDFKKELDTVISQLEESSEILGVIITGTGKAFSSGTDISAFPDTVESARRITAWSQELFNRIERLRQPVIAAINGYALGGGFELALCCDLRVASDKAKLGFPEVKICAIPCYGGTQRLTRLIGAGRAKEIILTGEMISAEEAFQMGIVNRVCPAGEELMQAEALMETLLKNAPLALTYAKLCINEGAEIDLDHALSLEQNLVAMLVASEDMKEGVSAFLEKRTPVFRNR